MPPRWLPAILARIRELAAQRKVRFTMKALRELAGLGMGLDEEDARDVLASLIASEFDERLRSTKTSEWMYVFKPEVGGVLVYVKVILRANCLVISFHEEEGSPS
jgi:Motility quorum-sensing regulator, toxin of MqsA